MGGDTVTIYRSCHMTVIGNTFFVLGRRHVGSRSLRLLKTVHTFLWDLALGTLLICLLTHSTTFDH